MATIIITEICMYATVVDAKTACSSGCCFYQTAAVIVDCRSTARMLFPSRRAAVVDLPGIDIAAGAENACPTFAYGRHHRDSCRPRRRLGVAMRAH